LRVGTAAVLLFSVACRASPKSVPPTPTPAQGPRVVFPSGKAYTVEVVRTPEAQAQGLMFREGLPERTGMLFPFSDRAPHRFWMKNTMIPLDIIWLDAEGRVLFVSANTPPCRADPCPSYGPDTPIASVLEIAGGMAKVEKVTVGASIRILDIGK